MKLSDRIKRKMMGVNLSSVAFFAVSMIAITLAWFAYTNTISSNFNVNLKSWNIKITKNNTEISNSFTIDLDEVYPGMTDFSETYSIKNEGDLNAKIDYNITYFRVFNDEITLNDDITFYEITRDYPFKLSFEESSRYLPSGATRNFTVSCTWPLDSGNDQLDTQYGELAFAFQQQEQQHHTQDPSYVVRPGIELKVEIVVSQYIDETNSFSADSWDTIELAVDKGDTSKYNVGDTKTVAISGTNYTVRLVNKTKVSNCSNNNYSQTACGFVAEFTDLLIAKPMNESATNVGGYPASSLYAYIQKDIFDALPYTLRKTIATTRVISSHGNTSGESNFTTSDKLYLLSGKEIFNYADLDTAASSTKQLDYYSNNSVTSSSYGNYTKKNYSSGTPGEYWLRVARSNSLTDFRRVNTSGSLGYVQASTSMGISPAFRIGNNQ